MTPEQLERFGERAAIREYDGGFVRKDAERLAMLELTDDRTGSKSKQRPIWDN